MSPWVEELPALEAFGGLVRRRRDRRGWSQRDLGAATGVDQTVISRIENGKFRNLRIHQIAPLLCALAPEILEVRQIHARSYAEVRTWETVRPFEPPTLLPPVEEPAVAFTWSSDDEPPRPRVAQPFARVER